MRRVQTAPLAAVEFNRRYRHFAGQIMARSTPRLGHQRTPVGNPRRVGRGGKDLGGKASVAGLKIQQIPRHIHRFLLRKREFWHPA